MRTRATGRFGAAAGAAMLALALAPGVAPAQGQGQAPDRAAPPAAGCAPDTLPIVQIRCHLDAAQAAGDPSLCERAGDATVRFHCLSLYAERTGNTGPCARIEAAKPEESPILRASCVAGVAVAAGNPELCREVPLLPLRDSCYLMLVTRKGADRAICARIENQLLRDSCMAPPPK